MVSCNNCGRTWPRDPRLEVECPNCGAESGQRCERPSGWKCSPHVDRDHLALAKGIAPPCSAVKNPLMPWEAAEKLDVEMELDDPTDPSEYKFGGDTSAVEREIESADL